MGKDASLKIAGLQAGPISAVSEAALRRRAIHLEYFTITWTVLEAIAAVAAALAASSIALMGFGLDSVIEGVSGVAVLWRFKQQRLEDEEAESRAGRVVGITFLALATYVVWAAGADLWSHHAPRPSLAGTILAAVALVTMLVLGISKRRVAAALGSGALRADSVETLLCCYFSAVLLIGLLLRRQMGWWWADPIAALAMVPLMIREGMEAFET